MKATINKPDIIQAFDFYKDRVYYKIVPGFFGSSNRVIRTDRLDNWNEWKIECQKMPDRISVNGKLYKLVQE